MQISISDIKMYVLRSKKNTCIIKGKMFNPIGNFAEGILLRKCIQYF